jgi:zinc transport system substrate-binding protein
MKRIILIFIIPVIFISCNVSQSPKAEVVTTNAWTAAYALAAGAEDVLVLTPYEMIHPSEYELRPGDISNLNHAEIVIYGGYEIMMDEIKKGLKISDDKLLQIQTSYKFEEIEHSVMQIAKRLGTEEKARENLADIQSALDEARKSLIEKGFGEESAVVHFFQQSFISEMEIETLAVFGPAPPEARQILDLTRTNATLIIDNAHNPSGGALRETMLEASYILLLNFPGLYDTKTLVDVIEYNSRQLQNME